MHPSIRTGTYSDDINANWYNQGELEISVPIVDEASRGGAHRPAAKIFINNWRICLGLNVLLILLAEFDGRPE